MLSSSRLSDSLNGSTTFDHDFQKVKSPLEPDALDPAGSHVVNQNAGDLGHLLFVSLDVSPRPVQSLFFPREKDASDRALGPDVHGLNARRGLEHSHDTGSVVGGACAQVPAIDVAADDHDFVFLIGSRYLGDRIENFDFI